MVQQAPSAKAGLSFGAIASIAGALVSLLGLSYLLDLDATVVNVVTVLGLGLSIDYGLLVVSRFREEMRELLRGRPVAEATTEQVTAATAATNGRNTHAQIPAILGQAAGPD